MKNILIRDLGLINYATTWHAMQEFTISRQEQEHHDELWILEHHPVFTQGQAGKAEHILYQGDIPIIQTDRGGQVTYHGPGQIVVYFLLDLRARNLSVRCLVDNIEQSVINLLRDYNIDAQRKAGAPGVYVNNHKICALGLRIKHGCSYHGLALNVDMDLQPFKRINPCGYENLPVTQMKDWGARDHMHQIKENLCSKIMELIAR